MKPLKGHLVLGLLVGGEPHGTEVVFPKLAVELFVHFVFEDFHHRIHLPVFEFGLAPGREYDDTVLFHDLPFQLFLPPLQSLGQIRVLDLVCVYENKSA